MKNRAISIARFFFSNLEKGKTYLISMFKQN